MHQTTALHESGFDGEKKDDRKILKQYLEKIMGYMEENKCSRKRFLVLPYRKNEFVLDEEEIEYIACK